MSRWPRCESDRMRTLILMRHGKAEREWEAHTDHARTLVERGRQDCVATASHLRRECAALDVVLVSTAARTRESWAAIAPTWPARNVIEDAELYLAPAERLDELSQAYADKGDAIMVMGHNPGLKDFASQIIARGGDHDGPGVDRLAEGLPTAWACVFSRSAATSPLSFTALASPTGIIGRTP